MMFKNFNKFVLFVVNNFNKFVSNLIHFKRTLASHSGEGNGTPLKYSCLENPMDRGAWWVAVHGVTEGRTRLNNFTFMHWRRKWQPTLVFLSGESQGLGSLVGCHQWGCTGSDMTEVTQQQSPLMVMFFSYSSITLFVNYYCFLFSI